MGDMSLNNTEQDLLILCSSFLLIFLILGIVALIYFIRIQLAIKKVIKNVEYVSDKAERITEAIEKSAPVLGLIKFLSSLRNNKK
jgi:hypothetical protein